MQTRFLLSLKSSFSEKTDEGELADPLLCHAQFPEEHLVKCERAMSVFLLFFWLAVSGCSEEKVNNPDNGNPTDTLQTFISCEDNAETRAGEYLLSNNVWGKGSITEYEQCIACTELKSGREFRWEWSWPETGSNVKAYPEIIYGWKPWNAQSTTDELPRPLADIDSIIVSFRKTVSVLNGSGNLAFDIWITSTDIPSGSVIRHEIMIWLERSVLAPGGTRRGTEVIDGRVFEFYKGEFDWTYLAFVSLSTADIEAIDLAGFFRYLIAENYILAGEYLASIEFGNEVVSGSGETVIRDYTIEVYGQ